MFGITGVRTWKELQGVPCIEFEDGFEAKQSICVSRSFSSEIYAVKELQEQVANFASTMAEKLRKQRSVASEMVVFAYTNRFKENLPQTYSNALVSFTIPTSDQRTIVTEAVHTIQKIFQRGYGYKKAGVIATKIMTERNVMHSLFEDREAIEREHKITSALDAINATFGKGTIKLAVQGSGKIKTSSECQSPHYTTRWSDIPNVTIK
jgi:DNA polymerase V